MRGWNTRDWSLALGTWRGLSERKWLAISVAGGWRIYRITIPFVSTSLRPLDLSHQGSLFVMTFRSAFALSHDAVQSATPLGTVLLTGKSRHLVFNSLCVFANQSRLPCRLWHPRSSHRVHHRQHPENNQQSSRSVELPNLAEDHNPSDSLCLCFRGQLLQLDHCACHPVVVLHVSSGPTAVLRAVASYCCKAPCEVCF